MQHQDPVIPDDSFALTLVAQGAAIQPIAQYQKWNDLFSRMGNLEQQISDKTIDEPEIARGLGIHLTKKDLGMTPGHVVPSADSGLPPAGFADEDSGLPPTGFADDDSGLPPAGFAEDDSGLPPATFMGAGAAAAAAAPVHDEDELPPRVQQPPPQLPKYFLPDAPEDPALRSRAQPQRRRHSVGHRPTIMIPFFEYHIRKVTVEAEIPTNYLCILPRIHGFNWTTIYQTIFPLWQQTRLNPEFFTPSMSDPEHRMYKLAHVNFTQGRLEVFLRPFEQGGEGRVVFIGLRPSDFFKLEHTRLNVFISHVRKNPALGGVYYYLIPVYF